MDSPLAHLDRAVDAWSASREAVRSAAGIAPPGHAGSLEDDVERHLADEAHDEWEGADLDGYDS